MGFDKRENARPYAPQEGDTLRRIAERETAAGNPVTWQELARFNWGTDDEAEVNAFLRDELGARRRDTDNNFVLAADDEPHARLLIPAPFSRRGLAPEKTYTLRVRKKEAPAQFLECCHVPGVTFGFNSSFVRPSVVEYLRKLARVAGRHPDAKIMIFGHTDATGDDAYNKKLSERRAWSVHAFVTNDADAWEVLYNHPDEAWGVAVVQEILADLGHDPGAIDGGWGTQTRTAMRSFLGLPEQAPVQNDAAFRKQLFAAYMASKHDIELASERFMDPAYMGCGEFNRATEDDGEAEQNRRVTFFFFNPERLPALPCAFADTGPCGRQMVTVDHRYHRGFRCSFFDSLSRKCGTDEPSKLATLRIRLFDPESRPISHAPYRLTAHEHIQAGQAMAISGSDPTDQSWIEAFLASIPDRAVIEWGRPGDVDPSDQNAAYPYRLELHLDCDRCDAQNEQAMRRLNNLGYPSDVALSENLRTFQHGYGLESTGELDDRTRSRLWSVHDACDPCPRSSEPGPTAR